MAQTGSRAMVSRCRRSAALEVSASLQGHYEAITTRGAARSVGGSSHFAPAGVINIHGDIT